MSTTTPGLEPLVGVTTTDLAAITRGRFVAAKNLERISKHGIGWLQANICLTPFNSIANPNPWGARGDLRVIPDLKARYRTEHTGRVTPFDIVFGNIVGLDGSPWNCCTRTLLKNALNRLRNEHGINLLASFEQEFQLLGAALPPSHALSFAALRSADEYTSRLMAALDEAGVDPEVVISEFGADQFEVTCGPSDGITASDRCVVIREVAREIARAKGWHASFAPKTSPDGVGNGVHLHFSFRDTNGKPLTYAADGPGGLSPQAAAFCAGILKHLPGITALTAPSLPSYYRLKPHAWSASYTWLANQHREATLRICPVVTIGGADPSPQFNIEYRAADATANPYLVMTAVVLAGLEGLNAKSPCPPLVDDDPTEMTDQRRAELGLVRLPESLPAALKAFDADAVVQSWFDPLFVESFHGVRQAELATLASLSPSEVCERYRTLY
jgi:glutamine synthetase